MSDVLLADISEYLEKILRLKAAQELEPLRQLALKHEDILKLYPLALQQMQGFLVPKAKLDCVALMSKVSALVQELKEFHIEYQNVRQWSEHWGTMPEWEAIQGKVALLHLPYQELNTLKEKHLQNQIAVEQERQRHAAEQERQRQATEKYIQLEAEQERKHQEQEERQRQEECQRQAAEQERQRQEERKRLEQEERQRQEAEERSLCVQERKQALFGFGIFIFICVICVVFGILTLAMKDKVHKPTDLKPVVEAPTAEPIVMAKQKKPEKIDKRVSLESYLKGIKNGCEFNSGVAILTPVLEAVKVSTGPNENDYYYTLPPDNSMVKKYPDLYKSTPVVEVKPEYFEVSADINGKFYGLTASKLIRGYGNENGVSFFTLVLDSPDAESILKKKIDFKTQWYELGHRELGAVFYVEDGKTYMTCNWSD
jgi:flagellar motor protein MotB